MCVCVHVVLGTVLRGECTATKFPVMLQYMEVIFLMLMIVLNFIFAFVRGWKLVLNY